MEYVFLVYSEERIVPQKNMRDVLSYICDQQLVTEGQVLLGYLGVSYQDTSFEPLFYWKTEKEEEGFTINFMDRVKIPCRDSVISIIRLLEIMGFYIDIYGNLIIDLKNSRYIETL